MVNIGLTLSRAGVTIFPDKVQLLFSQGGQDVTFRVLSQFVIANK